MRKRGLLSVASLLLASAPVLGEASTQFISTVQFVIQEPSPQLTDRAHRLLNEQFAIHLESSPGLSRVPFERRVRGSEAVFYVVTPNDMGTEVQQVIAQMIPDLNRRAHVRGLLSVFRAPFTERTGVFLDTAVNPTHTAVVSIEARSVALRDVFKQLKKQINSLSYFIPSLCADKRVTFQVTAPDKAPLSIDTVMEHFAQKLNLTVEKKSDTHIFSGDCQDPGTAAPPALLAARSPVIPINAMMAPAHEVYLPLPSLSGEQFQ